jgi:hypothetical protein
MPNWCENTLIVTGSNDRVKEFYERTLKLDDREVTLALNNLYPCPDETDWYNWRINNWGTKWECDVFDIKESKGELAWSQLTIHFNSAWSPPDLWVKYVAEHIFPDLHFRLTYLETGVGFCGIIEGQNTDFQQENGEILETDEEGKEVKFSSKDERYKYVKTGEIIDDEDFIPICKNSFELFY